jgi:ADP-ribosylglycohydrolase
VDLDAARTSLLGLAVGDAFGTMLDNYGADLPRRGSKRLISMRRPWRWTDDTAMAISVVDVLSTHGTVDPDALAAAFVASFTRDPNRGYGAGAFDLLRRVAAGAPWRIEAGKLFNGTGSYGNGAAMRAAPIGACFAGDLDRVRYEALRSAEPTHAHPDGAAGAVAVAIAASLAQRKHLFLDEVACWTPAGAARDKLRRAVDLGLDFDVTLAGEELGTGANISSRDTVPFALWVAARHLESYEEAMWTATFNAELELSTAALMSGIDRDTIGAIVGGVVACATGIDGIPLLWREATETLV